MFKNIIDKTQVRRIGSQKYLIKFKSNFQSHEDPVFFLDTDQEIKIARLIFKLLRRLWTNLNQRQTED